MSCAIEGCSDPMCSVCSVASRFAHVPQYQPKSVREAEGVRARALAGTKPARTNRDPVWIKRKRKAL